MGRKPGFASTKEFVVACKAKHGDRYDYSKTVFTRVEDNITIICKIHGERRIKARWHLVNGGNCRKCFHEDRRLNRAVFFAQVKEVHKNLYLYDEASFVNTRSPITVFCSKHGKFRQNASDHQQRAGCPACARICRRLNTEIFVKLCKEVHENRYDYSKTHYKAARDKVMIICPSHGRFEQIAYDHLAGKGCEACGQDRPGGEQFKHYPELRGVPARIYLVCFKLPDKIFYKIGITTRRVRQSFQRWQRQITVIEDIQMGLFKAYLIEQKILKEFIHKDQCFSPEQAAFVHSRLKELTG